MERLRRRYVDRVRKDGHALTLKELKLEAARANAAVAAATAARSNDDDDDDDDDDDPADYVLDPERQLPLARREFKRLAQLEPLRRARPKHFMTQMVPHFGCVQVDLAQFRPDLAADNGGHRYFVMAVEMLSGLWAVAPAKTKTMDSFLTAIKAIFQLSPIHSVRVLLSDRESALHSRHFVARLKDELGINAQFLAVRSKAYAAELALRWMKVRLSRAMVAKGTRCWTVLVDPIVRSHNAQRIPGTRYRRVDVNKNSWLDVAEQILSARARRAGGDGRVDDAGAVFNTASVGEAGLSRERWKRKLFKFRLGDKVLLSRRSDYRDKTAFPKPSVDGAYGERVHTVIGAYLRDTIRLEKVTVYKLRDDVSGEPMRGFYYDNELLKLPPDFKEAPPPQAAAAAAAAKASASSAAAAAAAAAGASAAGNDDDDDDDDDEDDAAAEAGRAQKEGATPSERQSTSAAQPSRRSRRSTAGKRKFWPGDEEEEEEA